MVFVFFFLIWVFGSGEILVGNGQWWRGGHGGGGGGVVMIGLFGCCERDRDEERGVIDNLFIILLYNLYYFSV